MRKKSQAAAELLMTYGWAALILVAAAAAVSYFGFFDFRTIAAQYCEFPSGLDCVGKPRIDPSADEITLAFKNSIGSPVNITAASTGSSEGGCVYLSYSVDAPTPIDIDQKFMVKIKCGNDLQAEGIVREEITITYVNEDTGLMHPAVGLVKGTA